MKNLVAQVTNICLLTLALGCQLNDTDSAPLAPEAPFDDTESSTSPTQVGSASGARDSVSARDAAVSSDAGTAQGANQPPQANTPSAPDAAIEAGGTPDFPPLPSLEAGLLTPGNSGAQVDAGISEAGLPPNS